MTCVKFVLNLAVREAVVAHGHWLPSLDHGFPCVGGFPMVVDYAWSN